MKALTAVGRSDLDVKSLAGLFQDAAARSRGITAKMMSKGTEFFTPTQGDDLT